MVLNSIIELYLITQTSSGGTWLEYYQRTHQFQMLTTNGEWDKLQYSINITKLVTDIEQESQDMFLGMVQWTNQLCHILLTKEVMFLTVLLREIAILLLLLSDSINHKELQYII